MREVVWRGHNGSAWIKGNLIQQDEESFIVNYAGNHVVITETIGQWTGMRDCKDMQIYEGDVILFEDEKFTVEWAHNSARFIGVPFDADVIDLSAAFFFRSYLIGDKFEYLKVR